MPRTTLAEFDNLVVSPSATGKGVHIRWVYSTTTSLNEIYPSSDGSIPSTQRDEEIALRAWRDLQINKIASEQHLCSAEEQSDDEDEVLTEVDAFDDQCHPLPKGVKGLGPEGTWIIADGWSPRGSADDPASTNQLPVIYQKAGATGLGIAAEKNLLSNRDTPQASSHCQVMERSSFGGLPEFVQRR